jgi:uncharacterized protein (TIGR02996 family)
VNHQDAFFQDILEHPDDPAPRLIYADWLEEHGDGPEAARGRFIRLHCELAGLPPGDARRPPVIRLLRELLAEHEYYWTEEAVGPVRELLGPHDFEFDFRAGFLESLTLDAWPFIVHASRLFRLAPLRQVRLRNLADPRELAGVSELARLSGLDLSGNGLARSLGSLTTCPHLADLRRLGLCNCRLGLDEVRQLTFSPHLANLTALLVGDNHFGEQGMTALLESALFGQLTTLDLSRTGLTNAAVRTLALSPNSAALRRLNLSGNGVSDDGLRHLGSGFVLGELTLLDLVGTQLGSEGAAAIAAEGVLPSLSRLFVSFIGQGPGWGRLRDRLGSGLIATSLSWHEERVI